MKKALIIGSNRGIGLELVHQLKQDFQVTAVCRRAGEDLKKEDVRIIEGIDVSKVEARQELSQQLGSEKFDLIFHNAGILERTSLEDLDENSIRRQFEVNALAPLMTVESLLGHFADNSILALMTSRMGSIGDNSSGGSYGYRMSKSALNAAGVSLAHDLKSRGISVAIIHPGYVKTDMTNHSGNIDTEECVQGIRQLLSKVSPSNTGQFWHSNGEQLPW